MDYVTLTLAFWALVTMAQASRYYGANLVTTTARFVMVKGRGLMIIGGVWWGLIGAPLAAYFAVLFFFSSTYQININTIIATLQTFSGPSLPYVLLFLLLWAVFAFGYFGSAAIYKRLGK